MSKVLTLRSVTDLQEGFIAQDPSEELFMLVGRFLPEVGVSSAFFGRSRVNLLPDPVRLLEMLGELF